MAWHFASSSCEMVVSTVVMITLGTYLRTSRAKIEHALECGVAEFAANEFVVFVSVGRIQRNGNRVDDAFEFRGDITAVDEAAYARWRLREPAYRSGVSDFGCDLFEGFERVCWLRHEIRRKRLHGRRSYPVRRKPP